MFIIQPVHLQKKNVSDLKMKKINLAISGCMGRMGQQLIKSSKSENSFKLTVLTENRPINKKFNGIKP